MASFVLNGEPVEIDADDAHPLLWILRERCGLIGPKFGCGVGQCGACTVLLNGDPIRACSTPLVAAEGAEITTIEGLGDTLTPVQEAWIEMQVPQCGYCQSGPIMSATALLASTPEPTDEDIDRAMSGNLCRCGTYVAIRRAIHRAAEIQRDGPAVYTEDDGQGAGA